MGDQVIFIDFFSMSQLVVFLEGGVLYGYRCFALHSPMKTPPPKLRFCITVKDPVDLSFGVALKAQSHGGQTQNISEPSF